MVKKTTTIKKTAKKKVSLTKKTAKKKTSLRKKTSPKKNNSKKIKKTSLKPKLNKKETTKRLKTKKQTTKTKTKNKKTSKKDTLKKISGLSDVLSQEELKEIEREVESEFETPISKIVYKNEFEQDKTFIIWTAVTFFMTIVLIAWVSNIKAIFYTTPHINIVEDLEIDKLYKTFDVLGDGLDELKKQKNFEAEVKEDITKKEMQDFKERLEKTEQKMN